jgi:exodeoxyribonuclease VII large subunit
MLIDDVAAVSCSTPTHAAEAAVPCHPLEARTALARHAASLETHGRRAVLGRAKHLAQLARGPAQAVARHRARLHQHLRELRASARRRLDQEAERNRTKALVLGRKARAVSGPEALQRRAALDGLAAALAAHDPERTVARGYAIVDDGDGNVVTSAAQAREARDVRLFFGDGPIEAHIKEDPE